MAEVLAIVGFAVAVPGVAVSFSQCGDYLRSLVRKFKQAPETIQKIGLFGHDLSQGKLKMDLELAGWVFSQEDIDVLIKDTVEDSLKELQSPLAEAVVRRTSSLERKETVRQLTLSWLA